AVGHGESYLPHVREISGFIPFFLWRRRRRRCIMGLRHFDPGRGGGVVKSFTFVHTADLHLDKPMEGWRGGKDRLRARREEFRRTFERIVELAKRRQADFL